MRLGSPVSEEIAPRRKQLNGGDTAGRLLEVGLATGEGVEFIVDAMPARPKFSEVTTMPRSIQEILDHADELAKQFEDYEPSPDDERPVGEYRLQRAIRDRARSEREVVGAVEAARAAGVSWSRIGELLGTSAQAAHHRYAAFTDQA